MAYQAALGRAVWQNHRLAVPGVDRVDHCTGLVVIQGDGQVAAVENFADGVIEDVENVLIPGQLAQLLPNLVERCQVLVAAQDFLFRPGALGQLLMDGFVQAGVLQRNRQLVGHFFHQQPLLLAPAPVRVGFIQDFQDALGFFANRDRDGDGRRVSVLSRLNHRFAGFQALLSGAAPQGLGALDLSVFER